MEEVKAWFTSRGLGPRDLAKGLLIHEVRLATGNPYKK